MADDRNEFIENGWRQFCIVRPGDHPVLCKFAHVPVNAQDFLLIVTQTCDLVNNIEKEPYFEVACMRPLDRAPSSEYMHGKNSRRLEMTVPIHGADQNYFILPHERFFVPHEVLKNIRPYATISDEKTHDLLIKWITSRYNRAAFPDAFDRRWKKRKKQIEAIIKQLVLVQDIYICLEPFFEIKKGEYEVVILLLMDAEHYDTATNYKQHNELRRKLEDQLIACDGIEAKVTLESNARITVVELQQYKRWDYSHLSYADPDEHEFPGMPAGGN